MINLDKIHKGMDVVTSDDHRLGTVREVMEHVLFLNDVEAVSEFNKTSVPMIWIIGIDDAVRLAKSREQVEKEWHAGPRSGL
ncbi:MULTISPECIES: DUF2171 domain-containing protein [Microvirga]|uniref:DUF2171 domain-containing protein n=1 Tax=Microvirga TaxID=186650 RepID=UPI001CFFA02C|nr:DUF2171 domain-containing protein [Microvirga lenta]MCB5177598.1 DUF2171 domain-containing protein [Microvirga lenta]